MKKQLLTIAAGLALGAAGLLAQGGGMGTGSGAGGGRGGGVGVGAVAGFQQFGGMGGVLSPSSSTMPRITGNAAGPFVSGSPLSAVEERKTVQTLGDGTAIENSDSNLFYRDTEGRTRVEQIWKGKTVIGIVDPVGRFWVQLDPVAKTARKMAISATVTRGAITVQEGSIMSSFGGATVGATYRVLPLANNADKAAAELQAARGVAAAGGRGGAGSGSGIGGASATMSPMPLPSDKAAAERVAVASINTMTSNMKSEDLGMQSQNGVLAQGSRNTLTISAGQIGNNRDIHVVNERWYSKDLEMLVKSLNSDPRFGVTTYELTKISQTAPDPSLFVIPGDYTVMEGGGRGGQIVAAPIVIVK